MIKKFEAYSISDWDITDYDGEKILSVKRNSDGEIFSVGDTVGYKPDGKVIGEIDRIWKSFEQMRMDVGKLGLVLNDDLMKVEEKTNEEVNPLREGPTKTNIKKFNPDVKKGPPPKRGTVPIKRGTDQNTELLRQMVQLSNNSRLTQEASIILTESLDDEQMIRVIQWFYHANRS